MRMGLVGPEVPSTMPAREAGLLEVRVADCRLHCFAKKSTLGLGSEKPVDQTERSQAAGQPAAKALPSPHPVELAGRDMRPVCRDKAHAAVTEADDHKPVVTRDIIRPV